MRMRGEGPSLSGILVSTKSSCLTNLRMAEFLLSTVDALVFLRSLCVCYRHVPRHNPRTHRADLLFKDEHKPLNLMLHIEAIVTEGSPTLGLATGFDAYTYEPATVLNREVLAFPVVRHLRLVLARKAERTERIVLTSISLKFPFRSHLLGLG